MQQRLEQAKDQGRELEQAFLQLMLARRHVATGESGEGFRLCQQALAALDDIGLESGRAAGYSVLGGMHAERSEFDAALGFLGQALSLLRALGWHQRLGAALANLSMVQQGTGNLEQAVASLEEATQLLGDGNGPAHQAMRSNFALALARWAREQRDEGADASVWRANARRAVALMQQRTAGLTHPADTQDRLMQYAFGCMAAALVVLDELPQACDLLEQLRPLYVAANDARAVLFVDTELTRAALQAGQPARAAERAQLGIAHAETAGFAGKLDELHRLLADALEQAGDYRAALQAHRSFHRLHKKAVLDKALHRTRALAVTMETERARQESRLDPLTGLPNRRAFDESLARSLAAATADQPVALALLDMDHFKQINDSHGHAEGDAALQLLADLLKGHPRPGDTAARLGGDEFVLLVTGGAPAAAALCTRLREALRDACLQRWPDRRPVTLSIGIASAQAPVAAQELLARADRALYAVKAAGRDAQAEG